MIVVVVTAAVVITFPTAFAFVMTLMIAIPVVVPFAATIAVVIAFAPAVALAAFGFVKLNVSATRTITTETPTRGIAIGENDLEGIVPSWLAVIGHLDCRRASYAVNRDIEVNEACQRCCNIIASDSGGLDMHSGVVIDVIQVAPESAVANATSHAEVRFSPARPDDPAATRDEVFAFTPWGRITATATIVATTLSSATATAVTATTADVRMGKPNEAFEQIRIDNVQRSQRNDSSLGGRVGDLGVNDQTEIAQIHNLVRFSCYGDVCSINGQPLDIRTCGDDRAVTRARGTDVNQDRIHGNRTPDPAGRVERNSKIAQRDAGTRSVARPNGGGVTHFHAQAFHIRCRDGDLDVAAGRGKLPGIADHNQRRLRAVGEADHSGLATELDAGHVRTRTAGIRPGNTGTTRATAATGRFSRRAQHDDRCLFAWYTTPPAQIRCCQSGHDGDGRGRPGPEPAATHIHLLCLYIKL